MFKSFMSEKVSPSMVGWKKGNSTFYISNDDLTGTERNKREINRKNGSTTEKYSFLQYALLNFRESVERYDTLGILAGSLRGTMKLLEFVKGKRSKKGQPHDWTWKEVTDMVKYSSFPIVTSLLPIESDRLNRLAVDSFIAIMKYMGDHPFSNDQRDIECVYTILVICHHHAQLRDEVYCQLMKQTTNNKSRSPDSCIRGWRLLVFMTAFYNCSETLKPYLQTYLKNAAQDYRRSEQDIAEICLRNLQQTMKYGGRRNVPSEREVESITVGEMSTFQTYYLPGGFKQEFETCATTIVRDVTSTICSQLGIYSEPESREFSLYCIVEGDLYTMPLEADEYIMDLVTELERNKNGFYLIICRSVWHFPLRLDSELYINIIFHQVVPDYLEGFLLVTSLNSQLPENILAEASWVAGLLHRSAGMDNRPTDFQWFPLMEVTIRFPKLVRLEVLYLLPKPVLSCKQLSTVEWMERVGKHWEEMTALNDMEAKAQCLELLQKWPLFGSCFFGIKVINQDKMLNYILAVNKNGVNVLEVNSHETLWRFSFSAVHPLHNIIEEEDATYADIECGDKTFALCMRLQVDHAHEVSRLIHQYQDIQQRINTDETKLNLPNVMIRV